MKSLLSGWKNFVIREELSDYSIDEKIRLYHYARSTAPSLVLDPEYFLAKGSSYTRDDFNTSQLPRVFFYTDLDHAEKMVQQEATLYSTTVYASDIYDLQTDPFSLKEKGMRYPGIPVSIDYDWILRSLANKIPPHWESKTLLPSGAAPYSGVFYALPRMDIVVWFKPIEVEKFFIGGD